MRMRCMNIRKWSAGCDGCNFNCEQPQISTEERLPTCYLKTIWCNFIVVTSMFKFLSYFGFNRYRMLPKGKKLNEY